ncbi:FAD-dependent oxidoreductase [Fulvivirgaceae bacterium BMA12]|uniref:FAD-dependent oxidoreductase n=1 Tax=Agaribacillus aureus TaxID=3051825 RepID=A0ABT8L7Y1_9BACT|nr:FAD-dependent oxidoreductase [Fulvivirgaceae bacterium BMA12]
MVKIKANYVLAALWITLLCSCQKRSPEIPEIRQVDVLIVGGGASGTMAAIQAARMGSSVLVAEETPWLGGMLTAAGVSAIDGNYKLQSGLWEEFRKNLYNHYGGPEGVKTGWVSNVLFEPEVGDSILKYMAGLEDGIELMLNSTLGHIEKTQKGWIADIAYQTDTIRVETQVVIDGTELGDVAALVGIPYEIGMDSRHLSNEKIAPETANDIVQDLTYVAILKDYGKGTDMTITKPEGYDPSPFYCTCAGRCNQDSIGRKLWDCEHMMGYGRLPGDKYMINWPIFGNDFYLNVIEMAPHERKQAYEQAKWYTMCYVYYLQDALGFRHLGIADDVFPTADGLPFIPYHRESRRIDGIVRFDLNDLARPFAQTNALYRTGVAVGDYPVDHHHAAYPQSEALPDLHFYPVPSYALPLGTLIPKSVSNFIVAEKSISVTNLVNGTTRLQPVCLLIGQAAGALAALAVDEGVSPADVPVRKVQQALLDSKAYILPYLDVSPTSSSFSAIQKTGATGILRGEGKNIGWENQTLFYPDSLVSKSALQTGLQDIAAGLVITSKKETLTVNEALKVIYDLMKLRPGDTHFSSREAMDEKAKEIWKNHMDTLMDPEVSITRAMFSVLLGELIDPFSNWPVDHHGTYRSGIN